MQVQELEVVDGQQRLATLSLLYSAIHACLAEFGDEDGDMKHELFNLRHRIVFKGPKKMLRLEPSYQGNNYHGKIGDVRDLLTFLSATDTLFLWLAKPA